MNRIKMGTATGTLFSMVFMVSWQNILDTAILAAVGASVSFCVSWILKKGAGKEEKRGTGKKF